MKVASNSPRSKRLLLERHASSFTSTDFRIPTAEERVQDLIDVIVDAEIHHGIENSLTSTLENVLRHLENDRFNPACNNLGAFINRVNAQDGKHIPQDDAEQFRNEALGIQNQLGC